MFIFKQKNLDLTHVEIVSEQVVLSSILPIHSDDILKEFNQDITRYMVPAPLTSLSQVMHFIGTVNQFKRENKALILAVLHPITRAFYGIVALVSRTDKTTPELGIWIKASVHGNKFGTYAIHAISAWAQHAILAEHLIYPVDKRNVASRKIAESLGGEIIEERLTNKEDGGVLDEVVYEINVSEIEGRLTVHPTFIY